MGGASSAGAVGVGGGAGGSTLNVAMRLTGPNEAVIATAVAALTVLVATAKVAMAPPPGISTLGGTLAAALPLPSVTTTPPSGAAPFNVTLPCAAVPPVTLAGVSTSDASASTPGAGGSTHST